MLSVAYNVDAITDAINEAKKIRFHILTRQIIATHTNPGQAGWPGWCGRMWKDIIYVRYRGDRKSLLSGCHTRWSLRPS